MAKSGQIAKSRLAPSVEPLAGVLERVIATTQDAVVFIDSAARIVQFNRAAERTFGYLAGEVVGENVKVLMPEPYRNEHDTYLRHYERTGQARAIGVIRTVKGRRKGGETFPLELSITEVPPPGNVRYAAFLRDISDKIALQEQLLERERLASLGMAASILAHEIGNPLNNMYLEAQLLQRRLRSGALTPASAGVRRIMDEVERLGRLLEEFRSVSRSGQAPNELCDLAEVAEYVASHLAAAADGARVRIEREFPPEPVQVQGRPDKLRQAVMNLAKNGLEAMPEGGVLRIHVTKRDGLSVLSVHDTGDGLPEGVDILRAFCTTKSWGTGLGLSIVNQVVAAHHGSVSWDSRPGEGASFHLTFPKSPASPLDEP